MELSKKTTILFPPDLHSRLLRLARQKGTSLGDLVRSACEKQYDLATREERLAAVEALSVLDLPVGTPEEMARESVPAPEELMP